jgi:hypothetical protein
MTFPSYQPCPRCERPCVAVGGGNPEARLLKLVEPGEDGLCPDCSITSFIMSVETLMYGIEKNGMGILLDRRIQVGFEELMKVGNADAKPEQINWQNVVDNWHLDMPERKGKANKRQKK